MSNRRSLSLRLRLRVGSRHRSVGPSVSVVDRSQHSLASLVLGTMPARAGNVPLTNPLAAVGLGQVPG